MNRFSVYAANAVPGSGQLRCVCTPFAYVTMHAAAECAGVRVWDNRVNASNMNASIP